ncbi:MAG: STAS domain-containing protein [Gammaproteobacteria bacterium]
MAEEDEDSLIGYDPLAWLNEADAAQANDLPLPVELEEAAATSAAGAASTAHSEVVPDQGGKIVLDASQTIRNVAELHERLLNALNNSEKIDIDASAVSTIDTATLQLLLVLKQTASKMQKHVAIDFPSERFIEAADLLGLSQMLDVDRAFAGFF